MARLSLLFHANQVSSPYVTVAGRVCYRGLWAVLRRHPRVRCSLHLSGTLLHGLLWLDPEALAPVHAGLEDGQFELLGSTYAQNVPYASDDRDNALQIAEHLALLGRLFGVRPQGFWNAERCWRQSLVPLIADAGLRYTLAEEQALRRSGANAVQRAYWTQEQGRRLDVYPDHESFKHLWNRAVWSGSQEPVLEYLRRAGDGLAIYAEDAEATGLWGYERGLLPQADWARLDALLTRLEQEPSVDFVPLGELPRPLEEDALTPLHEHQAAWMVHALSSPEYPYHEPGYRDWFDFNARAERLAYFRDLYTRVRAALAGLEAAGEGAAARLAQQARRALCAHQYEFGCIGVGGVGDRLWQEARTALVVARAAELAGGAQTGAWREDVNADGEEELLLCNHRYLAAFTHLGGRLLYWFDLERGAELVGNENPYTFSPYMSDAAYPVPALLPVPWLPENDAADLSAFGEQGRAVDAPGPMGVFLPESVWRGGPAALQAYMRPAGSGESMRLPAIQQRALNDSVQIGQRRVLDPAQNRAWAAALDENGVTFSVEVPGSLRVDKHVTLGEDGLGVHYVLRSLAGRTLRLAFEVDSELCPGYFDAMDGGRAALRYWTRSSARRHERWRTTERANHRTRGVVNTLTGLRVELQAQPDAGSARGADSIFALALALRWELALEPGAQAEVRLSLAATA